jgi:rhodanese-related sulfurtransferase
MAETEQSTSLPPARAEEMAREGVPLIDVRSPDEHDAGHIPGDRPIPFDQLKDEAASLPQDEPVVLYCRSGDRSGAAAQALRASGYDAYSVEGGLLEWKEQGLPLEPADGEVVERSTLPPA